MASTQTVTDHVVNTMEIVYKDPKKARIAEYTSPCSDNPYKFVCPVTSAREAMAALYLMSMVVPERLGISRISFTDHIAQMAFNYRYEGDWRIVQEILEQRPFVPYSIGKIILSNMNTNDYYGNFQPLVVQLLQKCKMVPLFQRKKWKVKRTQRKRGYDDKGTLRPSHLWLPTDIHLGENPEPEDYRCRSYVPRNRYFWTNQKKGDPPYE
jgi:hypothetical protein